MRLKKDTRRQWVQISESKVNNEIKGRETKREDDCGSKLVKIK